MCKCQSAPLYGKVVTKPRHIRQQSHRCGMLRKLFWRQEPKAGRKTDARRNVVRQRPLWDVSEMHTSRFFSHAFARYVASSISSLQTLLSRRPSQAFPIWCGEGPARSRSVCQRAQVPGACTEKKNEGVAAAASYQGSRLSAMLFADFLQIP